MEGKEKYMDRVRESRDKESGLEASPDYVAKTDEDGNVVAILDLIKKVLHYAGREITFFLVAGPEEKEYPSVYAKALIKSRLRRSGR